MESILVTGASGNVGSYVLDFLKNREEIEVIAAVSSPESAKKLDTRIKSVVLNFEKPDTFVNALENIDRIFLMRPPQISKTKTTFLPFIELAKKKGVKHIVFLSLIGVENNKIVPHYKIEQYILASGIPYTFLRAGFFMQNLNTTHLSDIKNLRKIILPAGNGKTSFVDTRDIAEVAALALSENNHFFKKYNLTGNEALTNFEVAELMSKELKTKIIYQPTSIISFFRHLKKQNQPTAFVFVVIALYLVTRFGKAAAIYPDIQQILNRQPISMVKFISDHKNTFE